MIWHTREYVPQNMIKHGDNQSLIYFSEAVLNLNKSVYLETTQINSAINKNNPCIPKAKF